MNRRLARLIVTAIAVTAMTATAAFTTPAGASGPPTDVCAGQGTAAITGGTLLYPTELPHATNAGFAFNFATGACATKGTLAAGGTVSGWCGLSSGWGTTNNGYTFAWVGVGSVLLLTGNLVGVVNAVPDVPSGASCLQPGADKFLVTGWAVLKACVSKSLVTSTTTPLLGFVLYSKLPC